LNFIVLILTMAALVSDHWSKNTGLYVGPWKTCSESGDCSNTIDAIPNGLGNVHATRFFMLIAVFPAWMIVALPFLAHFGKLDTFKTATVNFWSLIFIGVCTFVSMCVWAAFQYDTLAKYNLFGTWMPDWALGVCCLTWLVAFSASVVAFIWKLKAGGGSDLQQSKMRGADPQITQSPATYPVPQQTAPSYPGAAPLSYPTPQPLQQYGEQRPGVDV
jgi:hypothetical protein